MASSIYSVCFVAKRGLVGDFPVLVDPGFVYVIRDIDLYYNPSTFVPAQFFLTGDVGQTVAYTVFIISGGNRTDSWRGRQVITSGFICSSNEPMDVTVSGYKLTAP